MSWTGCRHYITQLVRAGREHDTRGEDLVTEGRTQCESMQSGEGRTRRTERAATIVAQDDVA